MLSRPTAEMLSRLMDDAFYYLVPAHSFAHGQGWSHDGITRTSGFQVLYAYVAAGISVITGLTPALPLTMTVLSAIALLASVYLLMEHGGRIYGVPVAATAVVLLLTTPAVPWQITMGLEWAWLLLTTTLLLAALVDVGRPVDFLQARSGGRARASGQWSVAVCALLAVLVRVDLAIFVAVFTLALAWRDVRALVWAAAGAVAAVSLTGLNSWLITGEWIPNSVTTKQFWSSTTDFLPAVAWPRLMRGTGPGFVLTELQSALGLRSLIVLVMFTCGAVALCAHEWKRDARRGTLAVASLVTIAAYTLAYARGTNIMGDHYAGNIFVPVFVLTCAALSAAGAYWPVVASAIGIAAVAFSIGTSWRAPYQLGIAEGAPILIQHVPAGARVAAWNAGLAGWQTGKRVTNLDGLANAEVVPSMRSGTLACYLRDARITHIMDYGFMFAGQIDAGFSADEEGRRRMLMRRNGYDSARLYRCATLIASHPVPPLPSEYRLFGLDSGCVAALCEARKP